MKMDVRQNFLETVNWGTPEALVNEWEALTLQPDPVMMMVLVARPGEYVVDPWGVTVYLAEDEPGVMPIVNEETKVIKDIANWREYTKAPDIAGAELDWGFATEGAKQIRENGKLVMSLMATGLFEQAHYLMGFEDTLVNLMIEKDAMHDLLDHILEFRMTYLRLLVENNKPDVLLSHDDFGAKTNLFMAPDVWREFFKPRYAKLYQYARENGIIVIHHSDSYCEPIVADMAEIGIDVWQGALPQNDIPKIQKEVHGKMVLMGGIDSALVDYKDVAEEEVRKETRRACEAYGPAGGFIPCLTYGGEGSIFPGVNDIIMDEIEKYNLR